MRNPVTWQEVVSRGTAIALMSNFTSVAEALKELVDNAIDYRWGQPLTIDITQALANIEPNVPQAMEAFEKARGDGVAALLGRFHAVTDQRKLQEKAQRRRDRLVVESDGAEAWALRRSRYG